MDDERVELKDSVSKKVSVKHGLSRTATAILEAVGGIILIGILVIIILL